MDRHTDNVKPNVPPTDDLTETINTNKTTHSVLHFNTRNKFENVT